MGTQLSPEKRGTARTQFLALVYCDQTAGWIRMPLGTEVNLGQVDVVLDRVAPPSHPKKRGTAYQVSVHVCCGQTAGWIK